MEKGETLANAMSNFEDGEGICKWFVDELDAYGRCQAVSLDDSCFISLFLWFSKRSSVRGAKTAPIALKRQKMKRLYDQFANKKRNSHTASAGLQNNTNGGNTASNRNSCLKGQNTGGRSSISMINNRRVPSPSLGRSLSPNFVSSVDTVSRYIIPSNSEELLRSPDPRPIGLRHKDILCDRNSPSQAKPPSTNNIHSLPKLNASISVEQSYLSVDPCPVLPNSDSNSIRALAVSEIVRSKLAAAEALKSRFTSSFVKETRSPPKPKAMNQELSLASANTLHNYVRLVVVDSSAGGIDVLTLDYNFLSDGMSLISLASEIIQHYNGLEKSSGFLCTPPEPQYQDAVMNGEIGVDIWPSWLISCSKAFWIKENHRGGISHSCFKSASDSASVSEEDTLNIPFHLILLARIELSIWGVYWRHRSLVKAQSMNLSENVPESLSFFLDATSSCSYVKSNAWIPISHSMITLTEGSSNFDSLFSLPISQLPIILDKAKKLLKYGDEIGSDQSMALLKPLSSFDLIDFSVDGSLDKILLMPISWILAEGKDEGGNYGGLNHPVHNVLKEVEHLWAEHAAQQLITSEGAVKSSSNGGSKRKKKKKKKKRKQSSNAVEKLTRTEEPTVNTAVTIVPSPKISQPIQLAKNIVPYPASPLSNSCSDSTRSDTPKSDDTKSQAQARTPSIVLPDSTANHVSDDDSGDWEKVESRGKKGRRRTKNQATDINLKVTKLDRTISSSPTKSKDQSINTPLSSPSRNKAKKTSASRRRQAHRKLVKEILMGVLDLVDIEVNRRRKQAAKELNEERRKKNEERRRLRNQRSQIVTAANGQPVQTVSNWKTFNGSQESDGMGEASTTEEVNFKELSKDSSTQTDMGFKSAKQDQGTAVTVSETVSGSEEVKSFASDLAVNNKAEHPPTLLAGPVATSSNSSVASSLEIPQLNNGEMHLCDVCNQLTADAGNFIRRRAMACAPRRYERASLIAALQDTVSHIWACRCRVEPYGSCATFLDLPSSDLDLVIYGLQPRQKKKKFREYSNSRIARLSAELEKMDWAVQIKPIPTATVPVIKILADPSRLGIMPINFGFTDTMSHWRGADVLNGLTKVDITFEGPEHGGIGSSFYVAHIVEQASVDAGLPPEQTVLVQLLMILKELLAQKRLNEPFSGGLSSYGLLVLVEAMIRHANIVKSRIKSRRGTGQNEQLNLPEVGQKNNEPRRNIEPTILRSETGKLPVRKSWASIAKQTKDTSPTPPPATLSSAPHIMTYAEKIAAAMREEIDDNSSDSDQSECSGSQGTSSQRIASAKLTTVPSFHNEENDLPSENEVLLGIDDNEDITDGIDVLYEGNLTVGKMLMLFLLTYGKHFDARTMAVDINSKKSPFVRRKSCGQIDPITGIYAVDPLVIYDPIYPGECKNISRSCFAFPSIQWMFTQCFTTLKHTVNRRIQQDGGEMSPLLELLIAY